MNQFKSYFKRLLEQEAALVEKPRQLTLGSAAQEIIRLGAVEKQEGGFCEWQPRIKQFAIKNPENMATALIFPLASIMQDWGDLHQHFVNMMLYLRARGNLKYTEKEYPNITWKGMTRAGRKGMEFIWQNREKIYNDLMPMVKDEDAFGMCKYLLAKIPDLGLAKAAFGVQILIGRLGCIDSVNVKFLEIPKELIDNKGMVISSLKKFVDKKTGELNERGQQILKLYIKFLEKLRINAQDDPSRFLWDTWCSVTAIRLATVGEEEGIPIQAGKKYKGTTHLYKAKKSLIELKKQILDTVRENGGKIITDITGKVIKLDDRGIGIASNIISKGHYDLMLKAMEVPVDQVKRLNQERIKLVRQSKAEEAKQTQEQQKKIQADFEQQQKAKKAQLAFSFESVDQLKLRKQHIINQLRKEIIKLLNSIK